MVRERRWEYNPLGTCREGVWEHPAAFGVTGLRYPMGVYNEMLAGRQEERHEHA